ncbi:hypothetical protein Tco_0593748 [Tanacetum coccineum]
MNQRRRQSRIYNSINSHKKTGRSNDKKEANGYEMNSPCKTLTPLKMRDPLVIGGWVSQGLYGKKLDDDVEKDIEDVLTNVHEKCGVVYNNSRICGR